MIGQLSQLHGLGQNYIKIEIVLVIKMPKSKKLKVARLGVGGQSPGPKGQIGGSNTTAPGGGGADKPSKIGPSVVDVPFKKPVGMVGSTILSGIVPGLGAAINYGAKQDYKNRQKFSKKEGLYRDFYKTTGKTLQPNSPTGKKYSKDAGYNKQTTTIDRGGEKLLPKPSPVSSVNEPLSGYKKPTVKDGVFNYTVGYSKGGMLRQGKPKLAKKGWK